MSDVRTDGEASEYSRRESITSRSLSDWNCSDSVRADDKGSSGACSTASSLFKVPTYNYPSTLVPRTQIVFLFLPTAKPITSRKPTH